MRGSTAGGRAAATKRKTASVKTSERWILGTQGEVARFFGVTVQTVEKWIACGCPRKRGRYDLSEIFQWLRERESLRTAKARDRSDPDRRYRRARAIMMETRVAERRQRLIAVDEHLSFVAELARLFRSRLLSLASSLGPQLHGLEAAAMNQAIKDRIWELLEDLSTKAGTEAGSGRKDSGA